MDEKDKKKVDATETSGGGEDHADTSHESKPERTPEEVAKYNLQRAADKAREQGIDPADALGIKPQIRLDEELADDTPLTVGKLREIQKEDGKKTALELAEDIEDETERSDVKTLLEKRISPSGDPQADLALARAAANAVRTAQVAQDANRDRGQVSRTAAGGSAPAPTEDDFQPTAEEAVFMGPPYNLSKEKIVEIRKKS